MGFCYLSWFHSSGLKQCSPNSTLQYCWSLVSKLQNYILVLQQGQLMCVHSQSPCGLQIWMQCLSKVLWTLPHWQLYEFHTWSMSTHTIRSVGMLRIHANPRLSPICLQLQEIVGKYVMMNSLYFTKQEASHFLWWWGISSLIKRITYVQVRSPLSCHGISVSTEEELMRFDFKANMEMEH